MFPSVFFLIVLFFFSSLYEAAAFAAIVKEAQIDLTPGWPSRQPFEGFKIFLITPGLLFRPAPFFPLPTSFSFLKPCFQACPIFRSLSAAADPSFL